MIKQEINLNIEQWHITAFYAVTHYETEEIIESLKSAGANKESLESAYKNLSSGKLNTGLCFTGERTSVLVVSVASSGAQLANSIVHELHHLASQIAMKMGYDLMGEDVCYLAGKIAQKMYPVFGRYLCDCCRQSW